MVHVMLLDDIFFVEDCQYSRIWYNMVPTVIKNLGKFIFTWPAFRMKLLIRQSRFENVFTLFADSETHTLVVSIVMH